MNWKNILKAELPPMAEAGTPITNEQKEEMNAWAAEYNNKLITYLNSIGNSMDSGWAKIDPQLNQVKWNDRTFSIEEFANELKALLREAVYGRFRQTNYAFTPSLYLEDAQRYVRDMMRGSTASNVFDNWINRK